MSENTVEYVSQLVHDKTNTTWSVSDVSRVVEKHGIDLNYVVLEAIETRSATDTTYLKFRTARDRQWIDNEFALYDGDYTAITPNTADIENGIFTFIAEPTLPVYIVSRSYDPYNAASDLLLEKAEQEAGEPASFSTQGGSFSYSGSSDIRTQARAYRARGRKVYSV